VCICVCMCLFVYVCLCIYMCVCICVFVCVYVCVYVYVCVCTHHAAALLAAVQPGRPAAVQRAAALVQTLAAGPAVAAGAAGQVHVRVCAVAGSPPAVRLPVLQGANGRKNLSSEKSSTLEEDF